ncbi:N,N-dimethylformamidase beta subunit family domain-containing protein [Pseudonocardia hierapolitana]|uniref:N,N-dimethylformamidase beta subunit family domain-containing protein n=1 Tax=Pseudonocardia hierapolitana TaxID=1128676 RepID=UPI0011BE9BD3|nr:N,N-dimethylformamidase beta subunit family domain-containing protein [Pseudonocardia hierapolitana]
MRLLGYGDRLSVPAGGRVEFKVSSELPEFTPSLVRLRRGGSPVHESDLLEEEVEASLPATVPGRVQVARAGSYVEAPLRPGAEVSGAGLAVWLLPTRLDRDREQTVLALIAPDGATGYLLSVSARGCTLRDAGGTELARLDVAPVERQWSFLAATVSLAGEVQLALHRPGGADSRVQESHIQGRQGQESGFPEPRGTGTWLLRVGAGPRGGFFNGRVARPVVSATSWTADATERLAAGEDAVALLGTDGVSALALGRDPAATAVADDGSLTAGGVAVNRPASAVPGPFWRCRETDFRRVPDEYDALHLHEDDLDDAGWETDVVLTVPAGAASGAYALKIRAGDHVDRIPFVVTAPDGTPPAPVLVVLPTWTYLAYANWRTYAEFEEERVALYGERRGVDPRDRWLARHPELGKSLYDVHTDGSGVMYSSRARPIVNIRPDYYTPTTRGLRHFAQDLSLLDWLDRRGEDYAVITDDELEDHGADALAGHRVVITGSHPEYSSARMLDAYQAHADSGGRLMYLGGNGFYHVTARHEGPSGAIEIRRARGSRTAWASGAGEEHLSGTGEPGGLWRWRGRAPQRQFGVGMTAQGFDKASGYRRTPQSRDDAVAWVFDGVDVGVGEIFGDHGPGLGGAAGDEIDRADVALGTPADAVVLASSVGHSASIVLVPDDQTISYAVPTAPDPRVRSDIVIFGRPGGGAVFAVGSIAWSTGMTHKGGDNDVSRITANVLDRFRDHADPVARA